MTSSQDIKKLYARSAGCCNICKKQLFSNDVHIGQMAHIIAKRPTGPRGDGSTPEDNSYSNLILLCANDHLEVDQATSIYTPEKLLNIKQEHEKFIASRVDITDKNKDDVFALQLLMQYFPFYCFHQYVAHLPTLLHHEFISINEYIMWFQSDNPDLYPFVDKRLQYLFDNLIDIHSQIMEKVGGYTPIPQPDNIPFELSSDNFGQCQQNFTSIEEDGYLHMYVNEIPKTDLYALKDKLTTLRDQFVMAHSDLVRYIKQDYPSVEIRSYNPNALI